jgi:hypothetical protein
MLCKTHDRDAPSRFELLLPGLSPAIQSRFPNFLDMKPEAETGSRLLAMINL